LTREYNELEGRTVKRSVLLTDAEWRRETRRPALRDEPRFLIELDNGSWIAAVLVQEGKPSEEG
jgi:hypothetical protein